MAEDKKRKRVEDSSTAQKKKKKSVARATQQDLTVKLASVLTPRVSPPIIAASPGLCVSAGAKFNTYSKAPSATPKRKKDRGAANQELLLHSSSHQKLDYTAREDKTKGSEVLKHYIGIFDPSTGQLDVVEAKKMVVRGVVRSQQAPEEALRPRDTTQSTSNLKTELGEEFGTRKAKKAIQSIKENAIKPSEGRGPSAADAAALDSIKEAAAVIPTRNELQAVVDSAKPIPKGNYDAMDIQDVYKPEELIGAEILNAIPVRDWHDAVKKGEPVSVRSRFVANRINRVGGSGENAMQRLRILRYLLFLMMFYFSSKMGKERGTRRLPLREQLRKELAPAPEPVIESIRRKFSDQGVIRKIHLDLIMTHCCVLASIIDSFEVNTWDLKEDLKLDQKQMNTYFSEVGAQVKPKKTEGRTDYIAKLALPLQFPKMKMQRGRR